jgi:hypothetical protein
MIDGLRTIGFIIGNQPDLTGFMTLGSIVTPGNPRAIAFGGGAIGQSP